MPKRIDYDRLRQGFDQARTLGEGFILAVERNGVPMEAISRLVTPRGQATMDEIARLIKDDWFYDQPQSKKKAASDILWIGEVTVDYGRRLSRKELHGQWFDWANSRYFKWVPESGEHLLRVSELRSVRKDTPTTGAQTARYGYVNLNRSVTDEQALAEIAKRRVIPATDLEAIFFGRQFPDEFQKRPIVGLGSFFPEHDLHLSVVLGGGGRGRRLYLRSGMGHVLWRSYCRFLVRE